MKAILVIDVPTETLENVIASVNICEQREGYNIILKRMGKMSLKPLPQKGNFEIADDHPFTKAEIMAYTYGITVGRNQVIEEISE